MRVYNELLGAEVDVPEEPRRIVSLAEDLTETLFMVGVGDRVVGVSAYCHKPAEACERVRVGTYLRVSYARLEQLRPDLILTTSAAQRRVNLELLKRGYPVYPLPLPLSLAGIVENVRRVGVLVNAVEKAVELEQRLLAMLARYYINKQKRRLRVYVEIDLGSPITVGAATYVDDFVRALGLENIFGDRIIGYFEPVMDEVKRLNPEVIIYDPKPNDSGARLRFMKLVNDRGWSGVDAVRQNRIIVTEGDVIAHYGPSLILDTLPAMSGQLGGD